MDIDDEDRERPREKKTKEANRDNAVKNKPIWEEIRKNADISDISDKLLKTVVLGITLKELLSVSLDLISHCFGVKRVPSLLIREKGLKEVSATKWISRADEPLFTCAAPRCRGSIEGTVEEEMPIDCGSEYRTKSPTPLRLLPFTAKAISKEEYQPRKYAGWIIPKFSNIKRGSRLTPERIQKLRIGKGMTVEEKEVFHEILFNREAAVAFDFKKKGYFSSEIEPPHVVPTIDHVAWQAKNFKVPKALEGEVINIMKDRMDCRALERSFRPYRNPYQKRH